MITEDRADRSWRANPDRYVGEHYRRAGRSGLLLPPISLGLWQNFGADRPLDAARAILRAAFDHGVTHIDLANNYGPPYGSAEETFAQVLRSDLAPYRDEIVVATKAGYDMWPGPHGDGGSRKYLTASLDASLRRTGLDYVDIFYHHRRDPQTPLEETASALDAAVRSGKALYVGVSNYAPDDVIVIADLLSQLGTPLTLVQPRYSLFDRRPEAGLSQAAERTGSGLAVFSPLAQGRLTDRYLNGIPEGSRATRSRHLSTADVTEDVVARAQALNTIAAARGQTLAQLALAWVLREQRTTTALIGASSIAQLQANLDALAAPPFTPSELAQIDRHAAGAGDAL